MRILIVNKFYYPRGGDCVCAMNTESMLREQGHEVAFYAMDFEQNVSSNYTSYFAPQISFQGGGVSGKLKALARLFAPKDVARSFNRLLDDFKPDVVHLNNIHSYLSPLVAEIAHERGIRVVWTLHDYKLICPNYTCLAESRLCEDCLADSTAVLKKSCMKGGKLASGLAYLEARFWNRQRIERAVDAYIAPSEFMRAMMIKGGFSPEKIHVVNNYSHYEANADKAIEKQPATYCYVGRLSAEKGVEQLLETAQHLPYTLKLAGTGPLADVLRQKYASNKIQFLGHLASEELKQLIQESQFLVLPSQCYENNPMSIIETLLMGMPVLGANLGGIPELIEPHNGLTYDAFDPEALASAIEQMFVSSFDSKEIAERAKERFSPGVHYTKLMETYHAK